ncbi:hypothetical protein WKH57_01050 [Niallia taxi]
MDSKKVVDDRTWKTLFTGTELQCINFIDTYLLEFPNDYHYIWIENK